VSTVTGATLGQSSSSISATAW